MFKDFGDIEYEIVESKRAHSPRITVHPDGKVVLTKPVSFSQKRIDELLRKSEPWVKKQQARFAKLPAQLALAKPRKNSAAYRAARARAREIAVERLRHFNQEYNFPFGTISIRDQKTRWGSCSAKGNLSFNYRITFLPPELVDYLIVHELAHVKEHNHSERFWSLVAKKIPSHKQLRKRLHQYSL